MKTGVGIMTPVRGSGSLFLVQPLLWSSVFLKDFIKSMHRRYARLSIGAFGRLNNPWDSRNEINLSVLRLHLRSQPPEGGAVLC